MKSCISTYSYHRLYADGNFTRFDAIDKTKELGCSGVELVLDDMNYIFPHFGEFYNGKSVYRSHIGFLSAAAGEEGGLVQPQLPAFARRPAFEHPGREGAAVGIGIV